MILSLDISKECGVERPSRSTDISKVTCREHHFYYNEQIKKTCNNELAFFLLEIELARLRGLNG